MVCSSLLRIDHFKRYTWMVAKHKTMTMIDNNNVTKRTKMLPGFLIKQINLRERKNPYYFPELFLQFKLNLTTFGCITQMRRKDLICMLSN